MTQSYRSQKQTGDTGCLRGKDRGQDLCSVLPEGLASSDIIQPPSDPTHPNQSSGRDFAVTLINHSGCKTTALGGKCLPKTTWLVAVGLRLELLMLSFPEELRRRAPHPLAAPLPPRTLLLSTFGTIPCVPQLVSWRHPHLKPSHMCIAAGPQLLRGGQPPVVRDSDQKCLEGVWFPIRAGSPLSRHLQH